MKFNTRLRKYVEAVATATELNVNSNTLTTEITSFPLEVNHDNLWREESDH